MGRMSIRWLSCLLILSVGGVTFGELVGQWKFDEGAGAVANDSSGNGHQGKILGTPQWVVGPAGVGTALGFNPATCTGVDCGIFDPTKGTGKFTVALWAYWDGTGTFQHFLTKTNGWGAATMMFQFELWGAHTDGSYTDRVGISYDPTSTAFAKMPKGEWVHLAWAFDGVNCRLYLNGLDEIGPKPLTIGPNVAANVYIGRDFDGGRVFHGSLDDVRIYSHALTQDEVAAICPPSRAAKNPTPADGATAVAAPLFKWEAGYKGVFHQVYLGTTPDLGPADLVRPQSPMTMYWHMAPPLQPGTTYYWRVDEIEADTTTVNKGNVWSFTTQALTAYLPTPADGAVDIPPAATLKWLPGQAAISHHVYFGSNRDAVAQGAADTDKGTMTETGFTPEPLESLATYYWRVDETAAAGGGVQTGPVWSFTTYLPVEDFESYTDKEGSCIFEAWIDGYTDKLSGSTVGNITSANGTYGETLIVHGGGQSMPFDYNNVNAPYFSQAERTWAKPQDWTAGGTEVLVLSFRGASTNRIGPVYLGLRDSSGNIGTVTHADNNACGATDWLTWKIPLSTFSAAGVKVTAVKSIFLGVDNRAAPTLGGTGRLYFDDIRLTKP